VSLAFVQHAANVRGYGHKAQRMLAQEPLARIGVAAGEDISGGGEL
jgi:hypothetical protein